MKTKAFVGILFVFANAAAALCEDLSTTELLRRIVARATENEKVASQYGFNAGMEVKCFNGDGSLKKMELRDYRTNWQSNSPRLELYQVNQAPLTEKERLKEEKNRQEWKKAVRQDSAPSNSSMRIPITWKEFCAKYDFTRIPGDTSTAYVLAFVPAGGKLQELTRIEKVLNHMSGRMWVDDQYRIVRLTGTLSEDVKFGFGLVKVDRMEMDYQQQIYGAVALPAQLKLRLHVKALVFRNEEREINTRFWNFHRGTDYVKAASVESAPSTARK